MTTITCSRCRQQASPMESCDFGGALGEKILANTCPACWKEWEAQRVIVINEYRLNLGNPQHFDTLMRNMKQFLMLPE
ncbi:MAG: Fe(2+)-trafficking protein [Nitrospirota bacterium]